MKILKYSLICACVFTLNTTSAATVAANLSQANKSLSVALNQGDSLSVGYDLKRTPIYRYSEWYSYAVWCTTDGASTLEYYTNDKTAETKFPALLSNNSDQQEIGLQISERGVFKIRNNSQGKLYVHCTLYNKFGL